MHISVLFHPLHSLPSSKSFNVLFIVRLEFLHIFFSWLNGRSFARWIFSPKDALNLSLSFCPNEDKKLLVWSILYFSDSEAILRAALLDISAVS